MQTPFFTEHARVTASAWWLPPLKKLHIADVFHFGKLLNDCF